MNKEGGRRDEMGERVRGKIRWVVVVKQQQQRERWENGGASANEGAKRKIDNTWEGRCVEGGNESTEVQVSVGASPWN